MLSRALRKKALTGDLRGEAWLYTEDPVGNVETMLAALPSVSMATSRSEMATAPLERTCLAVTPSERSWKMRF
jgi:hypothetical protein